MWKREWSSLPLVSPFYFLEGITKKPEALERTSRKGRFTRMRGGRREKKGQRRVSFLNEIKKDDEGFN
jgi:hypothetical protein